MVSNRLPDLQPWDFTPRVFGKNAGLADAMPLCFSILVKRQVSDAAYDFCSQFLG